MSWNPSSKDRYAPGGMAKDGTYVFHWNLTDPKLTDPIKLIIPPDHVLPVILIPGIMGSNLRNNKDKSKVWRLDNPPSLLNHWFLRNQPAGLAGKMALSMNAGKRQKEMHPARTEVDNRGAIPSKRVGSVFDAKTYRERGWGEVGEGSYHEFLLWLEEALNGQGFNPAKWKEFYYTAFSAMPKPGERHPEPQLMPGIAMQMRGLPPIGESGVATLSSDDLLKRARFRMPVYACGYNWLDSNLVAASRLRTRIEQIIKENGPKCEQVVLVTHSMGGLVARACQKLAGMDKKIAGIVHGVMPTVGAAVAYRRCKVGMGDEDAIAGLVIGSTGQEVTAVFAQAPGALQLLPTQQYRPGWLTLAGPDGKSLGKHPVGDLYDDIYLRHDRWWGLVREEWLRPSGGVPITWADYAPNIKAARTFHDGIRDTYHPMTYVFYGKDAKQKSFEGIHWRIKKGNAPDKGAPPSPSDVSNMDMSAVRDKGSNPIYVGGRSTTLTNPTPYGFATYQTYETSYWELYVEKQDGGGDGTVPTSSGAFPRQHGGSAIRQQFGLEGFAHEGCYREKGPRIVTLYALQKIAAQAVFKA
ncbi:alpha/beta hydrolase [Frateuria sp. Soil773]|uniref:esterase/lipase family protein n=1 Tax=Frateuria sp. Soil773 TaxID=1736407 RepID=UPI000AE9187E|nr:alpha/beta hydrolase [Frateuria sp. Soil773]